MNSSPRDIRVGQRNDDIGAGFVWVALGDTVLGSNDYGIVDVGFEAHGPDFHHVTVTFVCRSFATVPASRLPENPGVEPVSEDDRRRDTYVTQ